MKQDAAVHLEKATALNPNSFFCWSTLGSVQMAQKRTAEAESCFKRALELEPDDWFSHGELGGFYQETGRLEEAQHYLVTALEHLPDDKGFQSAMMKVAASCP